MKRIILAAILAAFAVTASAWTPPSRPVGKNPGPVVLCPPFGVCPAQKR